jgi:hypothetical protein
MKRIHMYVVDGAVVYTEDNEIYAEQRDADCLTDVIERVKYSGISARPFTNPESFVMYAEMIKKVQAVLPDVRMIIDTDDSHHTAIFFKGNPTVNELIPSGDHLTFELDDTVVPEFDGEGTCINCGMHAYVNQYDICQSCTVLEAGYDDEEYENGTTRPDLW